MLYLATLKVGAVFLPLTAYTERRGEPFPADAEPKVFVQDAAAFAGEAEALASRRSPRAPPVTWRRSSTPAARRGGPRARCSVTATSPATPRPCTRPGDFAGRRAVARPADLPCAWPVRGPALRPAQRLSDGLAGPVQRGRGHRRPGALDCDDGGADLYTRLLADPASVRERAAHMRLFISGSAPLLPRPCRVRGSHRHAHPGTLRHVRGGDLTSTRCMASAWRQGRLPAARPNCG